MSFYCDNFSFSTGDFQCLHQNYNREQVNLNQKLKKLEVNHNDDSYLI